jgi:ATP-dependent protease HslVU (ClpYQ) peptidase subunit
MTTIACKAGTVAYDSRSTADDVVIDDDCEKMVERGGRKFFMASEEDHEEAFIRAWMNGSKLQGECNVEAIVVEGFMVYAASVEDGEIRKFVIDKHWAIGSGAQFAIGAMDAGATAEQAVEIAKGRDVRTGGRVRVFRV